MIHCNCGVSRSPTILIAYFISKRESFKDAYMKVFKRRRYIKPNRKFFQQLFRYALQIHQDDPMKACYFVANFWNCDGKNENMTREEQIEFALRMDSLDFSVGDLSLISQSY